MLRQISAKTVYNTIVYGMQMSWTRSLSQKNTRICLSAAELSNALGYKITLPDELPFKYDRTEYLAMWSEIAEVNWYLGGEKTACFCQKKGSEDISGDYSVYSSESSIEIDGVSVTVKGNNGGIRLAVWSSGDMSYSLSTNIELDVRQLDKFVRAVTE